MNEQKIFRISFEPIFKLLSTLIIRAWPLILILAVLFTAISVGFATKLKVDTDIMSLLPSNDLAVSDFLETANLFGFSDKLIAVVESEDGLDDIVALEFMDSFSNLLQRSSLIKGVEYKLPKFSFNGEARRIADKFDIHNVFYSAPDGNSFLMFISPVGSSGEIDFSRRLMKEVRAIERQSRSNMRVNVSALSVNYAGGYIIALEESRNMEKNVKSAIFTSFLCVLLLFFFVFRRFEIIVCVSASLAMAILWTLMTAYFTVGSLNIITVAFAAILAGLGIDFGIHISNRFLFERAHGKNVCQAIQVAILTTGKGIFFSCATTSLAFYSLVFTDFKGAAEFGFLIGTGVILCMLAMLFVLPSFLIWAGRIRDKYPPPIFKFSNLNFLAAFVEKHGRGMAFFIVLIFTISSFYIFSGHDLPEFDNSLDNMSFKDNQGIKVQKEILRQFGNYIEPIVVLAKNKDPDQMMRSLKDVMPLSQDLVRNDILTKFESIFKYLPPTEKRDVLLERLGRVKNPEKAIDYLLRRFKEDESKREEYAFLLRERDEILQFLRNDFSLESLTYGQLKSLLPEHLFNKFFVEDRKTDNYYGVSYLYPKARIVKKDEVRKIADYLNIDAIKLKMTGMGLLVGRLEYLIQREFKFIILFINIALMLVLFVIYKRISLVFVSMIPLVMGLTATVILMITFGIKFNYINIIGFPLIIGMGIDDSIHMIYRYFENNEKNIGATIEQTGRAVLLTSLTTMCGFGSLIFTAHSGLMSLGIITVTGIGFCLIASLFVLPGLLMLLKGR